MISHKIILKIPSYNILRNICNTSVVGIYDYIQRSDLIKHNTIVNNYNKLKLSFLFHIYLHFDNLKASLGFARFPPLSLAQYSMTGRKALHLYLNVTQENVS